ncbi:CBS domain-containing protein [Glycomyces sp. TRM65418]|uniref:CBS domain-containing protein n=1 Tax=Glycomyces sp. TRM65418 TaxID=2867006 RepID=UPI001CE54156|nr:CBS domain-containing protein [Glycomyces sp. TRM65418]MCC3763324.1 CBS domain-containing protein [Glycomyces sp. TRM65418]QZD57321.1 CBS domain-containing protein [Glycomyces sp. TRM65418]
MRISEILRSKGSAVVTVRPEEPVRALLARLAEHNVGALVVSADGATVAGIVSERDVVRGLHADPDLLDAPVSRIMTADVHTRRPDDSIEDLMVLMTVERIRHVPVVAGSGALTGIVSIGDVVKGRIRQLEFEKEQLEGYIAGAS